MNLKNMFEVFFISIFFYIFVGNKIIMKNIHILPTDNPSRVYSKDGNYKLDSDTMSMDWYISSAGYRPQNLYITSDDEIKVGDWCIDEDGLMKCTAHAGAMNHYFQKIILTTDADLIKDGVQAIDDEFLEWFIKNPSCEEVELGKTNKLIDNYTEKDEDKWEVKYHIYIPKEQDKKLYNEEEVINILVEFSAEMKNISNITKWFEKY
jgi:hypothetical protein